MHTVQPISRDMAFAPIRTGIHMTVTTSLVANFSQIELQMT